MSQQQLNYFYQQAGGHKDKKKDGSFPLMLDQRGNILKSVDPDDVRGKREEQFYSKVFSLDEFKSFKKFLPQFYGVVSNQTGRYIVMENLLSRFMNPNIIDIKIGQLTSDPFASIDKILLEKKKYLPQSECGYRISASKTHGYESSKGSYYGRYREKKVASCKSIIHLDHLSRLRMFLCLIEPEYLPCTCHSSDENDWVTPVGTHTNGSVNVSKKIAQSVRFISTVASLIQQIVDDLVQLLNFICHQYSFKLYASSILIIFDTTSLFEAGESVISETYGALNGEKCPQVIKDINQIGEIAQSTDRSILESNVQMNGKKNIANGVKSIDPSIDLTTFSCCSQFDFNNNLDHVSLQNEPALHDAPKDANTQCTENEQHTQTLFIDTTNGTTTTSPHHSYAPALQRHHKLKLSPIVVPYNLRVIDFGHAFFGLDSETVDQNYIHGLKHLIEDFKGMLNETNSFIDSNPE